MRSAARELVVALDQGSSSSRALALGNRGQVLARAQFPLRLRHPAPGFVEHDPEELARTLERALDAVLSRLPANAAVAAVGLAAQRSTVVFWDARTGRSAGPALSWMDGRAAAQIAPFAARQAELHERTGLYLTPYYSAPKIRHQLEHEPAVRRLAQSGRLRVGPVPSYLLWRLTGGEVFRVDPAHAQRMLLYNIRLGDWDPELLAMFGVPRDSLPEIVPSAGPWAVLRRAGRKLPVLAVMGDQQSAALGQGGGEEGIGVLNYGTGAFFLLHTGETLHQIPGLLSSVAWSRGAGKSRFFVEGTVHAAGTSFDWLRENLGLLSSSRAIERACRRSKLRVLALPAIGGLGAPRWDYLTPTVFWGLGSKTRPEDIVRGVAESIAFLLGDIVAAVRAKGLAVRELRASGGLAQVAYLLEFQAEILGQPIARLAEREATALGAAFLAAEQAGLPWAGTLRAARTQRLFTPRMPAEAARALNAGWRRFVDAQRELAASLRELGFPR